MTTINTNPKIIAGTLSHVTDNIKTNTSAVKAETMDFVEKIRNSTTSTILKFLETNTNPVKLRGTDEKLYRYKNILLYRSNGTKAINLEQNLQVPEVNEIAPKYVQYFQIGKDDFLTILEADTEHLLPFAQVEQKVSPQVKQEFKKRVIQLAKAGLVNQEVFANKEALLLTKDGKHIIAGDWGEINAIPSNDKPSFYEFLKKWQV